jgi:site-specific recombinase XerD
MYLKEIGVVIGIDKKMSHHLARRTFATIVLLFNDVPMEIVSAFLGPSKMSVTQDFYAKTVNKKIAISMAVFYKGGEG